MASLQPESLFQLSMTIEELLSAATILLEEVILFNEQTQKLLAFQLPISKFHSSSVPTISIKDYLFRIRQYSNCSDSCFVTALIYIDRVQQKGCLLVDTLNVHRLLIASVMLSAKFMDDKYESNQIYSRIGGLCALEMNHLELELWHLLDFSLNVTPEEFARSYSILFQRLHRASTPLPPPAAAPLLVASQSVPSYLPFSINRSETCTSATTIRSSMISVSESPSLTSASFSGCEEWLSEQRDHCLSLSEALSTCPSDSLGVMSTDSEEDLTMASSGPLVEEDEEEAHPAGFMVEVPMVSSSSYPLPSAPLISDEPTTSEDKSLVALCNHFSIVAPIRLN